MKKWFRWIVVFVAVFAICGSGLAVEDSNSTLLSDFKKLDIEVHGFWEVRAGSRSQNDPYEKTMSVGETRLQLDLSKYTESVDYKVKGDFIGDMVLEEGTFDLREANAFFRPTDNIDIKAGRQILTWGTGDFVFINDLFPKDWVSFFIGRDDEYLKAPSDAVKASVFGDVANLDIVFTPVFDPDRYISGERISYYNDAIGRIVGMDDRISTEKQNTWFSDAEIAGRVYKRVEGYELALYGYNGFWKSPAGQNANGKYTFPDLAVYGASARGEVLKGIGNVEVGYYDSKDDSSGTNPMIRNSEMRYLVGYSQEIGRDLTLGMQYYVEQMLQYNAYKQNLLSGPQADRLLEWVTFRLTKLLMNQNLNLTLFVFFSPSDNDAYLRPKINYKVTDNLAVETGANIFFGKNDYTFFGQFEQNTNLYGAVRYSF